MTPDDFVREFTTERASAILRTNDHEAARRAMGAAGAAAVGFVNSLFEPADVAAGNWGAVETRAAAMLQAARDA